MPAWKKLEYKVAEILNGRRIPSSGRAKGFKGDVESDEFLAECKQGQIIPSKIKNMKNLVLKEDFILLSAEDLSSKVVFWWTKIEKEARDIGKLPLLVMRPKNQKIVFILFKTSENRFCLTSLKYFDFAKDIFLEENLIC